MIEGALELAVALLGLFLFAAVFGLALDNHARRLDPASQYYVQPAG
jgi:hypothetical protein